jgi:type IV pilus assembly protein PilB
MRMGQLLEQMGKLSGHDIDEILQEQLSGGPKRPFGEIALTMGLCEPQHIWHAWVNQLSEQMEKVNLQTLGVDAQAVALMPRELAMRFCAVPVRIVDGQLIIAVSDPAHAAVFEALRETLHAHPHFVLADAEQIRQMITRYYPGSSAAA